MNTGPEWDTPEFLLMHIPALTDGLVDMEVAERVIHEMPVVLRNLEAMGIDFTDPDTGDYLRTRAFGLPGEYHLNFDGNRFKYRIAKAVKRAGSKLIGRTMITDILVDDQTGEAYGGLGFNVRTGECYVIRARATIVATGDVNRISRNASGMPFDSWHYPYNTGDGHAMAFRVGAELVNMEFIEATLTPRGFSVQGTNSYAGLGAHFINRHGERFMFKYDPRGEKARRTMLVEGVIAEVLAGNDPLYIDLRHLPDNVLDHFVRTLGVDRHTLPGYFEQRGIDIRSDPIELSVSELSIRRGGVYFRGSGLMIDADGEPPVKSLDAAGD
jgi:adenylylsulfate reductase, subunit A